MARTIEERIRQAQDRVRNLSPERRVPKHRYTWAALELLDAYLDIRLIPNDRTQFFEFAADEGGRLPARSLSRARLLAEALFELSEQPFFEEILRRISRDLDAAAWEVFVASALRKQGFALEVRAECGRKGADFDLTIAKDGEAVCVEVTHLRGRRFNENSVRNILAKKRKQLPFERPNCLVVILQEGSLNHIGVKSSLERVADGFFTTSRRINLIVFMAEEHRSVEGHADLIIRRFPMVRRWNPNPRTPSLITDQVMAADFETEVSQSPLSEQDLARVEKTLMKKAFNIWVDQQLAG